MHGLLIVNKAQGWTSHDVVARVRRLAGQREVGHGGTLDPLATGVLVVLLGKATKLARFVSDSDKVYCAEIVLGATTATDDAEGELLHSLDPASVTRSQVEDCVRSFLGNISQVPPAYAAIKREGKKLYELARQGRPTSTEERAVRVYLNEIEGFEVPRLRLRIHCSSGTYIRSMARDIGQALGVGGYLHALQRVESGKFTIEQAVSLQDLDAEELPVRLLPSDSAVAALPAICLSSSEERTVRHGGHLDLGLRDAANVRLYGSTGALVALGQVEAGKLKPMRVLAMEETADARRT